MLIVLLADFIKRASQELNPLGGAHCNDIQNLTLRLMHTWVAITCFPREDVRIVRVDELRVLYAMVNRIKFSPVKFMVR